MPQCSLARHLSLVRKKFMIPWKAALRAPVLYLRSGRRKENGGRKEGEWRESERVRAWVHERAYERVREKERL